ncbi:MAG TPA: YbhB/YbcL family Raf kinase inhibitor-like protein [Anaeromyxobacteraceae bacterium]|nr:YbhB/YbcL family Raf kinase inhibitor-like protein [Anaeromyxobacteraceae bacterium]
MPQFVLRSPDVRPNEVIPGAHVFDGWGCTGKNVSPELEWSGAPAGTKSFALTVYDPDAPTGSGFWHWQIFNIPTSGTKLAKGAGDPKSGVSPAGSVQGRNDYGNVGYGGPCPPPGDKPHRYVFTVFALKVERIELDATATAAVIGFNINANTIAKASFTAMYGR